MFKTINGKIVAILGTFMLLIICIFLASSQILERQQDDGLLINLAGRQRMLTQKMSKDALAFSDAVDAGKTDEANKIERELEQTMRVFEATLFALKDGGSAPINLEMTKSRDSPAAANDEILAKLTLVSDAWTPFKDNLQALLDSKGAERGQIDYVLANNMTLLAEMNEAVSMMQAVAERKVGVMLLVQGIALVVGAILALVSIVRIRSSVIVPLGKLADTADAMSAGDLDNTITAEGTVEISGLAKSFDRLRISMINTLDAAGVDGPGIEGLDELDELDDL